MSSDRALNGKLHVLHLHHQQKDAAAKFNKHTQLVTLFRRVYRSSLLTTDIGNDRSCSAVLCLSMGQDAAVLNRDIFTAPFCCVFTSVLAYRHQRFKFAVMPSPKSSVQSFSTVSFFSTGTWMLVVQAVFLHTSIWGESSRHM